MKVVLLRHTPDPDKSVALSARLCYSPVGVTELQEKMSDEEAARLVRMLVRMGHFSPIEHVTFTFAIEGVSRVLTHQLVRHRIASYSQQSQRYVKEHNFESIMPPAIAAIPEAKAKFEACMQNLQDLYNDLTDHYGIANEDARYVLPNAAETKIVCTFNARSLYNAPVLFEKAGPDCVAKGTCKEGKMSCGILPKVKQYQAEGKEVAELFLPEEPAIIK